MGDANIYIGHLEVDRATDEVMDSIGKLKNILNEIGENFSKFQLGIQNYLKGIWIAFCGSVVLWRTDHNVKMKIKEIVGENYAERIYDTELKSGKL